MEIVSSNNYDTYAIPIEDFGLDFNRKKRLFFSAIALDSRRALQTHIAEGLWERDEKGIRDWGNVSEHCLVEAARVQVFASLLDLGPGVAGDLSEAAILHDFFKKGEKAVMESMDLSFDSYSKAQEIAANKLKTAGYSDRVVRLAGSVGHETADEAESILANDEIDDEDKAYLIMHYIDDYTINTKWAVDSESQDGRNINDLDRRMDKAEANRRYQKIGQTYSGKETVYQKQRRVGHEVEKRLAALINNKLGTTVNPIDLPTFIDNLLKQKINSLKL